MKNFTKYAKNLKSYNYPATGSKLFKIFQGSGRGKETGNFKMAPVNFEMRNVLLKKFNNFKTAGQNQRKIIRGGLARISEKMKNSQERISEAGDKLKQAVEIVFSGERTMKPSESILNPVKWYEKRQRYTQWRSRTSKPEDSIAEDAVGDNLHLENNSASKLKVEQVQSNVINNMMKWYGKRIKLTEWRKKDPKNAARRINKSEKNKGSTVVLIASMNPKKDSYVMYNDQSGRNFYGSLKNLDDTGKLKELGFLPAVNDSEDTKSLVINTPEHERLHIPLGVKSKITILLSPSHDTKAAYDATVEHSIVEEPLRTVSITKKPSRSYINKNVTEESLPLEAMSSVCFMPFMSDEGVSCMCNYPPMYSLAPSKQMGHTLLGQALLAGVTSPFSSIERDVKISLKNMKKYWDHLWDLGYGLKINEIGNAAGVPLSHKVAMEGTTLYISPKTGNLNKSLSGKGKTESNLFKKSVTIDTKDKRKITIPSTVDVSSNPQSDDLVLEWGSSHTGSSQKQLKLPPNLTLGSSSRDMEQPGELDSSNLIADVNTAKKSDGQSGGPCDKPKKQSKNDNKSSSNTGKCSSGAGGKKPPTKSPCKQVSFGDAVKEFFTSSCFWIRNSGAINFLLGLLFGYLVYNALMPKEDETKEGKEGKEEKNGDKKNGDKKKVNKNGDKSEEEKMMDEKIKDTKKKANKEAEELARDAEKLAKLEKERLEKEAKKKLD